MDLLAHTDLETFWRKIKIKIEFTTISYEAQSTCGDALLGIEIYKRASKKAIFVKLTGVLLYVVI